MFEHGRSCFIGLGTNKGDKKQNIINAITILGQQDGIDVIRHSSIYLTEPIGVTYQPEFYNCVVEIKTTHDPHTLLRIIKEIEASLGREPGTHLLPRPIDIDILLYGGLELDSLDLRIPHSRLTVRAFVLVPLLELDAGLIHPVSRKSLSEYLAEIKPPQKVQKVIDAAKLFG